MSEDKAQGRQDGVFLVPTVSLCALKPRSRRLRRDADKAAYAREKYARVFACKYA